VKIKAAVFGNFNVLEQIKTTSSYAFFCQSRSPVFIHFQIQ
jgi:hypothetical protein